MLNIFNKINVPKRYFIKLISSFLSIVLILTVIPVAILADMTSGNFNYIESDGKVIITKYLGPAGNVSIPATINEKQVVGIGDYCFYNSFGVTGITFNSSITRIGTWAFGYCSGLTDLSIPAGVVSIGDSAFQNCSNLTSISIPESVNSIGSSVFWNCGNLQNILINENNLFYSSESGVIYNKDKSTVISCIQSKLGSVIIPSSVSIIENYAYYNCSGITEIALTSNIVSIGDSAFENCYLLNNITIPSSVATVGNRAFKHCNSFTEIYIPDSVINLGEEAFKDCSNLFNIRLPNSITNISNGAFSGCSSITDIFIPNSVTTIGKSAFYGCSSLTSIIIPDSVVNIGDDISSDEGAFSYCTSLGEITLSKNLTTISDSTFSYCTSLLSIAIPNSVTRIGNNAFGSCSYLTDISLSNGLIEIGAFAFSSCSYLADIAIPNSVESIGLYAFAECYGLQRVDFGVNIQTIEPLAFYSCIAFSSAYFYGNAPIIDYPLFNESYAVNVYYLADKTGFTESELYNDYTLDTFGIYAPSTPTNLVCNGKTDTTVNLFWSAVNEPGITGYDIFNGNIKLNPIPLTETNYTVTNLESYTEYSFTVRSVNNGGASSNSLPLIIMTDFSKGDTNGEGVIDILDLTAIKQHLLKICNLEGEFKSAADVNTDGRITVADLLRIKKHLLGTQTISPLTIDFKGSSLGDPSRASLPPAGGAHNLIVTYQNNTNLTQNTALIVNVIKSNEVTDSYIMSKIFLPSEEYDFTHDIYIPSTLSGEKVEVDFILVGNLITLKTKHDTVKNSINNVR